MHGQLVDSPSHGVERPAPSPSVGWALTSETPPGHVIEKDRPGTQLWIAYLFLFAIGSALSFFGHSMTYRAGTATAGFTPTAAAHSGQVISAIGFAFIVVGLVVAVVAVARMLSSRNTTVGSAPGPMASEPVD